MYLVLRLTFTTDHWMRRYARAHTWGFQVCWGWWGLVFHTGRTN